MPFVPVSFEPLEHWDGWVEALYDNGEIAVRMTCKSDGEECFARLKADTVTEEQRKDLEEGVFFELEVGYHKDRHGTVRRGHVFKIVYDERTQEQLEADRQKAKERAKEMAELFGIRWKE